MNKLAVLLPTYNCADFLAESVNSILNQTYAAFDLYVYDDCSTDNTFEVISRLNDKRINYFKNETNLGIAKTLNLGLDYLLPKYEYIARMDADDWSFPNRFEKQLGFMDANPEIAMSGTQGYWLKDINQIPLSAWEYPVRNEYIKYYLLFAASFGHSSVIFRSDSFYKFNLRYNENILTCEDWDLWTRVVKLGKVANLPDYLMKYRVLENSNHRSLEKIKKHLEEKSTIISKYWTYFNIWLSPEQVFDYYYSNKTILHSDFINQIKFLINAFNLLIVNTKDSLVLNERNSFSYMLARRILDFWKRSKVNRFDLLIWLTIVKEVKFMDKIKLIKSIIR